MITRWFLNLDEEVSGPFSTEQIQSQLEQGIPQETLIWGRSQRDWQPLAWWNKSLPHLQASNSPNPEQQKWHLAIGGESRGPLTRKELIENLQQVDSLQNLMLWTKGMKAWLPVFDFHDLMDELGLGRRRSPRANIKGIVKVSGGILSGIGQLQSISEGGLGALGLPGGIPGQEIHVEIISSSLGEPIRAKAEIRYVTDSGYYGMHFTQISMEAKSTLIDYIRHCQRTAPNKVAA